MPPGVPKTESSILATFLFVAGVAQFVLGVLGGVSGVDGVRFGTLVGGEGDMHPDVLGDVAGCA